MTTAKRWLGTLARHYPSLLVSGVCHTALGEIEEQDGMIKRLHERDIASANMVRELVEDNQRYRDQLATITTTLNHYAAGDGLLAPLAAAVLREIEENSK